VDREKAFKEVWRAELLARLALLDRVIKEQASRAEFVWQRGWDATAFAKRSELLQLTRQHYVALLKQLVVDGQLPMVWSDLNPDAVGNWPSGHSSAGKGDPEPQA
jgi:hypothetical protein